MKSKLVEFDIPENWMAPEGSEVGSDFDLVCTLRLKKGNKLCLVKLGSTDMPGYSDNDDSGPPKYGQAKQMMTAGMPPMSPGS